MNIAIVTGASSGMGREMVIQLAERFGGKLSEIWVIARREERLDELCAEVSIPLRIFALDLTDEASREILRRELAYHRPRVRFLVNAAGCGRMGDVGTNSAQEEAAMVRLNCEALCAVTHLVLPWMPDHSRIIHFASAAAFLPQPGFAIYAATKAFVLSYSRALFSELRPRDIAVTAVCPGAVRTEFFRAAGICQIPCYKRLVMADCKKVVRLAIHDSVMSRDVSVYGPVMKAFRFLAKAVPHRIILKLIGHSFKTERTKES